MVGKGIYRCYICDMLNQERVPGVLVSKKLVVFPRKDAVSGAAVEGALETEGAVPERLSRDMTVFVRRLTESLTPLRQDDDPSVVSRVLKIRNEFKNGLIEVLFGRRSFEDWYIKTRQAVNLREDQMDALIYEALDGLTEPEAVEMRETFERKLTGRMV